MKLLKNHNLISVLAAIGVYLGLMLAGTSRVSAQQMQGEGINNRPLIDFAQYINDQVQSKKIDPAGTFSVTVRGPLTSEGKLDVSKAKVLRSSGDPKLVEVGRSGIAAINDSGLFGYLGSLGAGELAVTVAQDDKNFSGTAEFELKTAGRAKSVASGLNALIAMYRARADELPDDRLLLDNTSVAVENAVVTVALVMPAAAYRDILLKRTAK